MYICQTGCCFLQSARICYTAVYCISNKRWGPLTCQRRSCGAITSETASTLSRVRCARIFKSKICKKKVQDLCQGMFVVDLSRISSVIADTTPRLSASQLRSGETEASSTFTFQISFLNFYFSIFIWQLSSVSFHFSTFSCQLSFFNFLLSTFIFQLCICQLPPFKFQLSTFTFQCLLFKFHLLTLTFQLEQSWGNFRIVVRCSAVVACNLVELGRNFEWFSIFHRSRMLK